MYDYNSQLDSEMYAVFAKLGSALLIFGVILLALLIFMIIAEVKFYKKCGKQGWECIIPFYGQWVYVEIAGLNWWWFLLLIASTIVSLIFGDTQSMEVLVALATVFGCFVCNYNIAKKYHKDTGFAILMTLFPVVLIPIIAFDRSYQYDNSVEVSKNGLF